jgi:hypothetical protein
MVGGSGILEPERAGHAPELRLEAGNGKQEFKIQGLTRMARD